MKKVLLFLLLFGGGLALLILLQEKEDPREVVVPNRTPPEQVGPGVEIPLAGPDESDPGQLVTMWPAGAWEVTGDGPKDPVTGQRPRLYNFKTSDLLTYEAGGPGALSADDVILRLFDPLTDTVRALLTANRAYLHLVAKEAGGFDISSTEPVRMENVDLTILRGAPIVPVYFRIPVLQWTRLDGSFTSEDRVVLESPGLTATGTGMRVVTQDGRESITLVRDGAMSFELDGGLEAKLESLGLSPLVLARVSTEDLDRVRLTVDDGARLTLADGSVLNSQSLTVEGRRILSKNAAGEDTGRFVLDGAVATGQVSMQAKGGTLQGSEARLEFDAEGEPTVLTVSGSPRGDFVVRSATGTTANLTVEGVGPLRVGLGTEGRFELGGPAVASWPEQQLVVRASEWIRGTVDEVASRAQVDAKGSVKVSHPNAELEGPSLQIVHTKDAEGSDLARIVVQGPSWFEGRDPQGRVLTVESEGELTARTRRVAGVKKPELILERAERVSAFLETPVKDENNFTATCGILRDVVLDQRTFVAEGGVTYEIQGVKAEGDRLIANGERDFELFGTGVDPATVRVLGATAQLPWAESIQASANYLHITPHRIEAREAVTLAMQRDSREFKAKAADLTFEWLAARMPGDTSRPYRLVANGVDRAGLWNDGEELLLSSNRLEVEGSLHEAGAPSSPGPIDLAATGNVRLEISGKERELSDEIGGTSKLIGFGEELTWSVPEDESNEDNGVFDWKRGSGRLSTQRGQRVRSVGNLAGERLPYELSADWIEFDSDEVRAENPHLRIDSTTLPTSQGPGNKDGSQVFEASAERLVATRSLVHLIDAVHLTGESLGRYAWALDSDEVEIRLDLNAEKSVKRPGSPVPSALESVIATGNLRVVFNEDLTGTGDRMIATSDKLRLEGKPAHLETGAFAWEAGWTELSFADEVITTGPGKIVPSIDDPDQSWSIRYESLQPFQEGEVTILALRNVLVQQQNRTLRSNWALFWVDNEERAKVDNPLMRNDSNLRTNQADGRGQTAQPESNSRLALFQGFRNSSLARILNEVYVEGDVEYLVGTERLVRAESLYVDLVQGHSWIQGADLHIRTPETDNENLRIKADWIRHSQDGSLRAEDATLTSCSHDVPHYVIEVGQLRLDPIVDGDSENTYAITLKDNSLRFQSGARIPLPSAGIELDDQGSIDATTATLAGLQLPNLTLGSSAQFGTTVGTRFSRSFGGLGKIISGTSERLFRLKTGSVRGNWNYNGTWFGSRGVLLGLGFDVTDKDRFWFRVEADGIPDRRGDRGLVKAPKEGRPSFRGWYRARGRFYMDEDEWIDLRFSKQSDAGVQAEFFEREYVSFEQRETYLHWRKAHEQFFVAATVEAVPDDFLTEVQELPVIMFQRGRTPLGMLGNVPLLYSATADVDFLRRHSGSTEVGYADGFNGPSVGRFDTKHRFETPLNVGKSGLRLTPFVEGRTTAWNRAQVGEGDPLRAALTGGGELSMAFWKRGKKDELHTIAPKIGSRVTMGVDESGGQPIFFDEVDNPIRGHFVDAGVRSIWRTSDPNRYIDLDVTATHASDVTPDVNGWGIKTYGNLRRYLGDIPIAILHDSRHDLDDHRTDYSRTFFGIKPWDRVELGTGYNSGRSTINERLYETASIATRFEATPKWDLEFHQTFNLSGVEDLETRFVVRRFGHDMLFELELSQRAGSGTSFSIGFRPRIGWRRSTLGLFSN